MITDEQKIQLNEKLSNIRKLEICIKEKKEELKKAKAEYMKYHMHIDDINNIFLEGIETLRPPYYSFLGDENCGDDYVTNITISSMFYERGCYHLFAGTYDCFDWIVREDCVELTSYDVNGVFYRVDTIEVEGIYKAFINCRAGY